MDDEAYGGLVGAYPYALRASESWLFRSYAVLGGLLAALVAVLFTFALVGAIAATLGTGGGTFTFSRALFVLVGLLVVLPLLAPVLLVARHHRRTGSDPRYDAALAAAGYLFVGSLYVGLLVSTPEAQQQSPPAAVAPLVEALYALHPALGLLPPLAAVAVVLLVHRRLR